MTFYIKDPATDAAVRRLAKLRGKTLTETIREAVENEYRNFRKTRPLRERIKHIQDRIAARPKTGLEADKAFYDELSGQ
jgi:antitoxin VapB